MFLIRLVRWVVAGLAAEWRTFSSFVQPATQLSHHVMKHWTVRCTGVLEHVTSFDDINGRYSPCVHFTSTDVLEHVTSFDDINCRYSPGIHFTSTGVLEHVMSFDDINGRYSPGVHFTSAVIAVVFSWVYHHQHSGVIEIYLQVNGHVLTTTWLMVSCCMHSQTAHLGIAPSVQICKTWSSYRMHITRPAERVFATYSNKRLSHQILHGHHRTNPAAQSADINWPEKICILQGHSMEQSVNRCPAWRQPISNTFAWRR